MIKAVVLYYVAITVFLILLIKNNNTYHQHIKIGNAICNFNVQSIKNGTYPQVSIEYEEMESYDATLFRLWDWGCTRILPPEKYELVKPYLQKGNNK